MTQKMALVLGATGGIGGEVASVLHQRGWRITALHRDPVKAAPRAGLPDDVAWVRGDAMRADDVRAAARDAAVIVHAVNPPGYKNWQTLVLPMLDNSIAAAREQGARVLLPGTVYNYGPDARMPLDEDAPHSARTRKGGIRIAMERRLRDSGVAALVVRAGDFFGPRAANSWFSQAVVTAGRPVRVIRNPAARGVGHSWAFLPDLAETMARLLERPAAPNGFETMHFQGHWDPDGTALPGAIRRALTSPSIPVRAFPWPLVYLGSPFVTFFREMLEMRYLWRTPLRLDNQRLVAAIGPEPHTPLDEAVRTTLARIGCAAPA